MRIEKVTGFLHTDVGDVALWSLACQSRQSAAELRCAHGKNRSQFVHVHTILLQLLGYGAHRLCQEILILLR